MGYYKDDRNSPGPLSGLNLWLSAKKIIFSLVLLFVCSCGGRGPDTTPEVSAIAGDSAGKVYVGFGVDKKVSIYDGAEWRTISLPFGLSASAKIRSLLVDHSGILWAGTSDGIYKISGESAEYKEDTFGIFKCANIFQIIEDYEKNIWFTVGCITTNFYGWGGLLRLQGDMWTSYPVEDTITGISAHKDRGIYAFSFFRPTQSIYKFDGEQWIPVSLPIYHIYSMMFDKYGNLWLTEYNKLSKCPSDTECETYSGEVVPNINALDIDEQNKVWLGTQAGLVEFDGANFIYYTKENTDGKLGSDNILTVKNIGNTIWIGTSSGLTSFDGEKWTRWEWTGEIWKVVQ